jgi:hypothetical protein
MRRPASLLIALALLAGCVSEPMVEKIEPAATPGVGFVESITPAPEVAAAGGTAGSGTKYVAVRMADGTQQSFFTRATGLQAGERVEIAPDGWLRHPTR